MHEELSLPERIVYPLLIVLGTALLVMVTPLVPAGIDSVLFILVFSSICFLLHREELAFWIFRKKTIKKKKGRTMVKKGGKTRWVMDEIPLFAALFLKGAGAAAWVIALGSFAFQVFLLARAIWRRYRTYRKTKDRSARSRLLPPPGQVLFGFTSPFNRIIMIAPAGMAYEYLNGGSGILSSWNNALAVLVMFLIYFTIATFLSTLTIVLRESRPLRQLPLIWWDNYSDFSIYVVMLCPLGLLFALLYQRQPAALLLLAVPLYSMHRAGKNFEKIEEEMGLFIDSLANALDARDHYTYGHSDRVSAYSRSIAAEMGLSPSLVDEIERAGRIHDIGKIKIPDAILKKRDKLDDDEYAVMKGHAMAVKELFEGRSKLAEKIPVVLAYSHHERFDGKGYIFGKKGEEIPLGARILSVSDTFDALTTDRPYRKGMAPEAALGLLKEVRGTQLDPEVVDVFVTMFEKGIIQKLMEDKNQL